MIKETILEYLWEHADEYVSGAEIARRLSVSRTAVWKGIEQLREQGYLIESVTNKGYRLSSKSDVLSLAGVRRYLKDSRLQPRVYSRITSTNTVLKTLAEEGAAEGLALIAGEQTAGRGRRGRSFYSPPESGVYMSLLLRPRLLAEDATRITACAAVAVAEVLEELSGLHTRIKWVTDVLIEGKKVCGILTEMELEGEAIRDVVIGVGLNVHTAAFPEELSDKATSLYLETGKEFNRAEIIGRIMQIFEKNYECFVRTCDLTLLKDSYEAILINKGKRVTVLDAAAPYEGTALGIDPEGCLLVKTDDGAVKAIRAGEVSVRGLYSYV